MNDMKSMNKVFGACAPPRLVIGTPHNGVRGGAPPTMPFTLFTLFTVKHHTPGQRTPLPQSAPLAGWREATDRTSALRRFSALTIVAPQGERGMKGNGSQPSLSQNRELTKFGHTPARRVGKAACAVPARGAVARASGKHPSCRLVLGFASC